MKKVIVFFAAIVIAVSAIAQEKSKPMEKTPQEKTQAEKKTQQDEYVVMKVNQVWHFKDGKKSLVTTEVTLGNTTVMSNGVLMVKDGSLEVDLVNGDKVEASGKVIRKADSGPGMNESEKNPE